ncbi:hypothetical protein [Fodinibius sediminis]|uniref:7-cyano-7-deazaguanine synthase n=1 Tax=Fodinibius sediminis TaxID=1214077 RepID=A0A521B2Z2_9BACT|nr:hypothetical protein [Fodinibius sediminis]SMO41484.1 hypothetical protein SAMN06265218_102150 [Fodinibius sediminis]
MKSIREQIRQSVDSELTILLWTGGWDSTFRLLQLLFLEKREVQPLYVLDLSHRSPIHELQAMNEIRRELASRGMVGDLLKPTIYIDKSEIDINDEISNAWHRISKKRHLGKQYVWIASLCKQYGLEGIELSIQKRSSEESISESLAYNLEENRMDADEKTIFNYFSFPIINLNKRDMQHIAERENWMGLMGLTWFCHHPIYHPFRNGTPCGICNPCRIAVEEGFGHRIPFLLRFGGKYLKKMYHSSIMNFIK